MYKVIITMRDGSKKEFFAYDHFCVDDGVAYWNTRGGDLIAFPVDVIYSFEEKKAE